jgi:predicted DNA-binding transcriptional regulator AlpA
MSIANARRTTGPNPFDEKSNGHSFPSDQFVAQNLNPSQHTEEVTLDRASGNSEEVIFLRLPEVKAVTGLSKSSLYALIRADSFPSPVRLGPRAVAWVRSEIKQWASDRIVASKLATSSQSRKRTVQPALPGSWSSSKKWA